MHYTWLNLLSFHREKPQQPQYSFLKQECFSQDEVVPVMSEACEEENQITDGKILACDVLTLEVKIRKEIKRSPHT